MALTKITGEGVGAVDNLTVNRLSTNGDIAVFQKDGTTVGSIGVNGDRIYLTNAQEGIMIDQSANNLSPTSSTGTFNDNAMNLGESGNRWQDLYLSGGAYIGGTGSANYLDDYEEGTWTPEISATDGIGTLTYNHQYGYYTKIGNRVYYNLYLQINSKGTAAGYFRFTLPFTANNSTQNYAAQSIWTNGTVSGESFDGDFMQVAFIGPNEPIVRPYSQDGNGNVTGMQSGDVQSNSDFMLSGHFFV